MAKEKTISDTIIIKLQGGLGNQMFQYAFGKAVEYYTKHKVLYDNSEYLYENPYRNYELSHFAVNALLTNTYPKKNFIKKIIRELLIFKKLKNKINVYEKEKINWQRIEIDSLQYCEEFKKLQAPAFIEGFYQSEKYFKEISQQIKRDFTLIENLDDENIRILNDIRNSESVSLHIRRGDYLSTKCGLCSIEYYNKSISIIKAKTQGKALKIFVFTEDINWAKENIKPDVETIFVDNNKSDKCYLDMELMRNCKHNIIANSSFSWWGAWLNDNPNKIVIAPNPWFERIKESDIIPNDWITLYAFDDEAEKDKNK